MRSGSATVCLHGASQGDQTRPWSHGFLVGFPEQMLHGLAAVLQPWRRCGEMRPWVFPEHGECSLCSSSSSSSQPHLTETRWASPTVPTASTTVTALTACRKQINGAFHRGICLISVAKQAQKERTDHISVSVTNRSYTENMFWGIFPCTYHKCFLPAALSLGATAMS